ncbi:YncE family protein [Actinoplanes sp. NPDC049668]|uniref:YncE family protein n=1 Tax=unclassified Actinoplanes TaxID=2626549 RepID=UPI00339E9B0F
MRLVRTALAATVLAGSTAVAFGISVGTAAADTDEKLPITSFGDIAVDAVHKRVFISDPDSGKVVATTYQGHKLGELSGLAGVTGLALSADSNLLYAAAQADHAVVALTTETVTEAARYPVPATVALSDLAAPVNGKIWFSAKVGFDGTFGSVDTATDKVDLYDADVIGLSEPPALSSGSSAPGLLVVGKVSGSGGNALVYDVSSGAAELKLTTSVFGEYGKDVAIAGDGAHLIHLVSGKVFRTAIADGSQARVWPGLSSLSGVDVAQDGRVAISSMNATPETDVYIYRDGADTPESSFALPAPASRSDHSVLNRSITWEPGGSRLFAVTGDHADEYWLYTLNDPDPVVPDPTVPPIPDPVYPRIQLQIPASGRPNMPVTLTGTISVNGSPLPTGTELTVSRDYNVAPGKTRLGTVRTNAAGAFSFTDTPTVEGFAAYLVEYAGDDTYAAVVEITTIDIRRLEPKLALTRSPSSNVHSYGTTVNLTATLGTTHKNRVVEFWIDPSGTDQPKRLIKRVAVNAAGKASASVKLTRNSRVFAAFTGDDHYYAKSVPVQLYTGVSASTKLSRHYKTAKIGKTKYQYFRKSKDPLITHTVTAYPGRKVRTIIQVRSGGSWQLWSSRDTKLSSTGKASFTFVTGARVGKRFRVRVEYLNGKSGDSLNHTTAGAWKYFTYTK